VTQLVIGAFEQAIKRKVITEEEVTEDLLIGFLGGFGRKFYGIEESKDTIILTKGSEVVQESFLGNGVEVIPFRKSESTWSVQWKV